VERRSPYQGLLPFGVDDEAFFSGRARDVRLIVASLFASRLTLLYGPSGVGKSSVLYAGVLPRLAERSNVLVVSVRDWSEDPVRSIGEAAARACGGEFRGDLDDVLEACAGSERRRVMLVLDQFEHALGERDTDEALVESLAAALLRPGLPISGLIAIREDSLASLDRFEGRLPGIFDTALRLEYLDRDAGEDAIRWPLVAWQQFNGEPIVAEDELVEAVLDAVRASRAAGGIETAQLQLVMARVWEAERTAGSARLRSQTFHRLGGADGIVRAHVRDALDGMDAADRELAAVVLDRLVTPSGARIAHLTDDLARYAGVAPASLRPVLEHLAAVRVLRPVSASEAGGGRFEVYHELLADAVLAWLTNHAADRRAAQASAHLKRRVVTLITVAAIAAGVIVVLALAFIAQKRSSQMSRSLAMSATARQVLAAGGDPQLALALASRAAETRPTEDAQVALRTALAESHERTVLRSRAGEVRSVDISRDGRMLLTTEGDGNVHIWDRARARPLRTLAAVSATDARFCPDERRLVVKDDDGATLRAGHRRLRLARGPIEAIACSANGSRVAIRNLDRVRVFDARTGRRVASFAAPSNSAPGQVALNADGKRVAVPVRGGTVVEDILGRGRQMLLPSHSDQDVTSVAFRPDGKRVVTGAIEGTMVIWDLARRSTISKLRGEGNLVYSVAYSADGKLIVSAATDRVARVWDAVTGVPLAVLRGHEGLINNAVFGPDSQTVATASADGTLRLWHVPVAAVLRLGGDVIYGAFTRSGRRMVTATADGTVEVWDASRRRRTAHFVVPNTAHLAPAPNATRIAIADDSGRAQVWDPTNPSTPVDLAGPQEVVLALDYRPDGRAIALATERGEIRVVDPSGRRLREFSTGLGPTTAVAFSRDGRRIAAASGTANEVVLLDASSGRLLRRIRPPDPGLTTVAFNPDGSQIAAGGNDGAWIWNASTGRLRLRLRGHLAVVQSATFSSDGELLATASIDGETRLWDATNGDLIAVLAGRTASFGGRRFLLTTEVHLSAPLYDCNACGRLEALESRARRHTTRRFTNDQLKTYVGG
jgi:WD40 repeat protein